MQARAVDKRQDRAHAARCAAVRTSAGLKDSGEGVWRRRYAAGEELGFFGV